MTEGTVAAWLKNVGDSIEEGDILAEIETDKATMEFESFNEGTLLYVGLQEGEAAPVDSILAIIGPNGVDVSELAANYSKEVEPVKIETPKKESSSVLEDKFVAPTKSRE
jgi:pyruvate dehydrogenase E2 component (dihydrolipoamide acetyltransferase)